MAENKFAHTFHKMSATVRFVIAIAFSGLTYLLTQNKTASVQFMAVWITFAFVNLLFFWLIILTADVNEIKAIAKKQDSSRTFIFLIVVLASFISLLAIVLLLRILPAAQEAAYYYHVALSVASVICSWALIHTIFTFRYAHLFYTCKTEEAGMEKEHRGGLYFPDDEEPDYLDMAYFAFIIGMTFQVSDVQVTSSHIRRLVLIHGILSFMYNTVILALSINIIAGLVQK